MSSFSWKLSLQTISLYLRKFKTILFNTYFLSIIITIYLENNIFNWQQIKEHTIKNFIFLIFLYILVLICVELVKNLFSTNEVLFEDKISDKVYDLINNAKEYVFLISPFFSPGETLLRNIIQIAENGIQVTLIHNTKELENPEFLKVVSRLEKNCTIYNHPNLHSKLYFNEKELIISSLNLSQSSIMNSFEIGWLTNQGSEFSEVKKYVKKKIIRDHKIKRTSSKQIEENLGYCIRTKKRILFNKDRPIEINEYYNSNRANDGIYCHKCGERSVTSIDNPFCNKHKYLLKK